MSGLSNFMNLMLKAGGTFWHVFLILPEISDSPPVKHSFLKKVSLSCIHNILMIHSSNSGSNAELSLFSDIFTVIYKRVGTHDVLQAVHLNSITSFITSPSYCMIFILQFRCSKLKGLITFTSL